MKKRAPGVAVIALSPATSKHPRLADHNIYSREPRELINLLRARLGDPRMELEKHETKWRA
ncbi:MAG: hypothetical protein ACM3SW_20425 [Actinomycetota bacterium]